MEPTIVIGTESWLDSTVLNSEVFPAGYHCFRRDRGARGGGVFLLVRSDLSCVPLDCSGADCESVFCKVRLRNGKSLVIGSHYRPPGSSHDQFIQLSAFLDTLQDDIIILGGDFNLPDIDWSSGDPAASVSGSVYSAFFYLVSDFAFRQYIHDASRDDNTGNILDLLLCNVTGVVTTVNTLPGISDHRAFIADVNAQNVIAKKGT